MTAFDLIAALRQAEAEGRVLSTKPVKLPPAEEPLARPAGGKGTTGPNLEWAIRVGVPFTYAGSKNHLYARRRSGHVALRKESVAIREEITLRLMSALRGQKVAHNKVWLDILVQKPNHKGDAVNFVDLVCDAVKRAIPVDDRWYCIRRVDWQIVKENPMIYIGIGQESVEDCQICSSCGFIRPLGAFNRNRHGILGVGRECKPCRVASRIKGKE